MTAAKALGEETWDGENGEKEHGSKNQGKDSGCSGEECVVKGGIGRHEGS